MANTIKLKRGTSTPSTSDISSGEVAIDTSAKKLYINDSGTVKEIGGGAGTGEKFVRLYASGSLSNTGCTTAVGYLAGNALASGESENTLLGCECGKSLTTGDNNTIIGGKAGEDVSTGSDNTVVGRDAFKAGTGSQNTCIGGNAGNYGGFTGSNNLILGYNSDPSAANVSNEITLGNTSITKFRIPGLNFSIKDSTATDNYVLTVDANGDAGWEAAAGTTINNNSNNRIITGSSTANTLEAETSLTWNGSSFTSSGSLDLDAGSSSKIRTFNGKLILQTLANNDDIELTPHGSGNVQLDGLAWPNADGSSGEFLKTDGSGALSWSSVADSTKLPLAGGTMTGDLLFGDDVKARFGTGNDLEIYHDGSHSYIKDTDTGNLRICGHDVHIQNAAATENMARFYEDGAVELYYDHSKKAETVNGGFTVTGTCTATAFAGDGSALTGISAAGTGEQFVKLYINGNLNNSGSNTVAGYNAGAALTTGSVENTFYGVEAGNAVTTGDNNTFLGAICGSNVTTGGDNTGVGQDCLRALTSGSGNTAVGKEAFKGGSGCTASSNTAIGFQALKAGTTGSSNTAVGSGCLVALTTATSTTALGTNAGSAVTTSGESVIIGAQTGTSLTTGSSNTLIGAYAGRAVTTGTSNVCVGQDSFRYGTGGSNTCIGGAAGDISSFSGSNNLILGYGADPSAADVSNEITLGDTNITKFRIPGLGLEATDNGISTDGVFIENAQTVTADYTITNGKNAGSFGPITINSGITVTVGTGETWTIV